MTGRPTFGFGSSGEAISLPTYHYRAISPKSRSLPAEHSPVRWTMCWAAFYDWNFNSLSDHWHIEIHRQCILSYMRWGSKC